MASGLNKEDLESLLRPQLGNDLVVDSYTVKPLTQPGENYGSTILAIEATVHNGTQKTSSCALSLVAKLVPPPGVLWKVFDPPNSVPKEICCYTLVKNAYEKLQKEKNIPKDKFLDVFPKCYGARTTLSSEIEDIADENSALLLENLKTTNYRVGNRRIGLDFQHCQLAITQLARFHALSIALKLLKPQVFKDTVLRACKPHVLGFSEEETKENSVKIFNVAKQIPGCEKYLDKIQKALDLGIQMQLDKAFLTPKEPYATLVHTDFWVNNMMFCYSSENENIPTGIKFVDFQQVLYTSPVKDLLFFMYTSMADGIRAKHHDYFINLYYENLVGCLKDTGCDVSQFSFKSLLDEIQEYAFTEVDHILFMLMVICAEKSDVPELSEIESQAIFYKTNDVLIMKAKEFITDFVERGWL